MTLIKVHVAIVLGPLNLESIDFSKLYQSKGIMSKNKSHTHFYESCELMKNYI